jgi:hypothetical protein
MLAVYTHREMAARQTFKVLNTVRPQLTILSPNAIQ